MDVQKVMIVTVAAVVQPQLIRERIYLQKQLITFQAV